MATLLDMLQSYHGGSYAAEQRKLLQEKLLQEKLLQQVDGPSLGEALPVSVANERPSPTVNTINTIDPSAELRRQADIVGGRFKAPFSPHDSTVAKLTPDWTQNREAYLAYLKAKEGKRATAEIDQTSTFSPEVLAEVRARTGAQKGIPGPHEGFPKNALVPKFMPQEEKKKLTSGPANSSGETKENTPNLWKTWGSLADDPKKRRDAYLSSIKNIYMKKMLLDSIAKLTGGKSQGDAWAQMAVAELDAIEKFDSEERLHNQWKALFFREDGTYDPPKNRKEAMKRGHQLGYDADQMKDIMSVFPKETDDRTGIEKNISYILSLEDGSMKRALMKRYGMIETDDLTAAERSADRAVRDGIITEKEREAYVRSIFVPTDASKDTAAMKNFEWYQEAEGEDKRLIGELLNIDPKGGTVDLFSPANIASLLNNDYIMDAFSEGEQARLIGIVKQMIPGFTPPANTGGKTPTVSAKDRAQQLKAEGKTKEQAKEMMREEGYDIG